MNSIRFLKSDPDRPAQVTYAVYLLYAILAIVFFLHLLRTIVFLIVNPVEFSPGSFLFQFLLVTISYVLMFIVARKIADVRNWARWLLLIGFVLTMLNTVLNMPSLIFGNAIAGMMGLGEIIVTALAVALLFQRPSSIWFKTGEFAKENDGENEASEPGDDLVSSLPLENVVEQKDSKPRLLIGAALLYAVVGAVACWAPPYIILFRNEFQYPTHRTSFGEKLMILAVGAFVAILIGLPLTYFSGRRFVVLGVILIGGAFFITSLFLAFIAGI